MARRPVWEAESELLEPDLARAALPAISAARQQTLAATIDTLRILFLVTFRVDVEDHSAK
jgi:hypothetical protein